jgi:RimJ/RimL family protein N-acetyltransferase
VPSPRHIVTGEAYAERVDATGLRLEVLALRHAATLFAALDDDRVGRFIGGPDVTTLEALQTRIRALQMGPPPESHQRWLNFAVLQGTTVVGRVEATLHDGIAEVAYLIGPRYWGLGFGTGATDLLIRRVNHEGFKTLWATTAPGNVASARVLHRLGFTEESGNACPQLLSYEEGDRVFSVR